MVYQYKFPGMYPVPAQTVGETLEAIYSKRGELQAADIVDESRPETAPLHPCFEWDDFKAAEKYRQRQANSLVECVVTVRQMEKSEPVEVRAYVHAVGSYHPLEVVVQKKNLHDELLQTALRDVEAFRRRLEIFSSLRPVKDLRKAVEMASQQLQEELRS